MSYQQKTLHSAAGATGNGTIMTLDGHGTVAIHFVNTGSPSGELTFEGSVDGTNYIAVPVLNAAGSLVTTATAAGYFRLQEGHGLKYLRVRISTFTSGAFTVVAGHKAAVA